MDQVEIPFSLRCPEHRAHPIGMLNVDLNTKKAGYCYECIAENGRDGSLFKTLKTVSTYLKDSSSFYEKCRQRVRPAGEPPAEYLEELSKKGERLEKFSKHIDQEKDKVKKHFEEIRKTALQIINKKEEKCLELLDKQISGLSKAYTIYEKILMMGWPKPPDIQNLYPETDILVQKMSQIESVDQLRAFMIGIHEDVRIQEKYFMEDDGFVRIKRKMEGLIRSFNIPDDSFPKIQSPILDSENIENLMTDLMKGFIQQEILFENSFFSRVNSSTYESRIIVDNQFETLRHWLSKSYKFDLKLLYRGSVDGMSPEKFHEKCDGKGATITLIKCRFDGVLSSNTIGGFINQSWHSNKSYSVSKEAFLFSLAEQSCNSVKCPILESSFGSAFYGQQGCGPRFGGGYDLYIDGNFKVGGIIPNSYSNAIALGRGNANKFTLEEVEIYQVK